MIQGLRTYGDTKQSRYHRVKVPLTLSSYNNLDGQVNRHIDEKKAYKRGLIVRVLYNKVRERKKQWKEEAEHCKTSQ